MTLKVKPWNLFIDLFLLQDDNRCVLAVDFGSTKVVAAVFSVASGAIVGRHEAPVPYRFPGPGRCEMDPETVWELFLTVGFWIINQALVNFLTDRFIAKAFPQVVRRALAAATDSAGVTASHIASLGLSVQRNSVMAWDRRSGRPLSPFLTWRDARASRMANDLNSSLSHKALRFVTRCLFFVGRQPKHKMVSLLTFKAAMASVRFRYLLQVSAVKKFRSWVTSRTTKIKRESVTWFF